MIVTIRESEGYFFASLEDSELEGVGESASEALQDLAAQMQGD